MRPLYQGCLGLQTYNTNYNGTQSYSEFALGKRAKPLDSGREYYATMPAYRAATADVATTIDMKLISANFQPNYSYTPCPACTAPRST